MRRSLSSWQLPESKVLCDILPHLPTACQGTAVGVGLRPCLQGKPWIQGYPGTLSSNRTWNAT